MIRYRKLRFRDRIRREDMMDYGMIGMYPVNREIVGFPAGYWCIYRPVKESK